MTGLDWPTALEIQFLYYRMRYFAERNATYVAVRSANMLCAGRNTDKRNVENWFFEMPMQKSGLEAKAKFKSKIQKQNSKAKFKFKFKFKFKLKAKPRLKATTTD